MTTKDPWGVREEITSVYNRVKEEGLIFRGGGAIKIREKIGFNKENGLEMNDKDAKGSKHIKNINVVDTLGDTKTSIKTLHFYNDFLEFSSPFTYHIIYVTLVYFSFLNHHFCSMF